MDEFKILLQAILDNSGIKKDVSEIQKIAEKYPVELETKIKTAKTKTEIQEITKMISNMLSKKNINIPDKQISSVLNSFINQANSLDNALTKSVDKIRQLQSTKSLDLKLSGIDKEYKNLESLGLITKDLENDFAKLKIAKEIFDNSGSDKELVNNYVNLNSQIERVINSQKIIKSSTDSQIASSKQLITFDSKRQKTIQDISTYLKTNSKITSEHTQEARQLNAEFQRIQNALNNLSINDTNFDSQFTVLNNNLQTAKKRVKELGLEGRSVTEEFKNLFAKFNSWFGVSQFSMIAVSKVHESIKEIKEIDDTLTEISKTSDLTAKQLEKLGDVSFESASKYGKQANDYLIGIQEMYRAGYENAEQMAELSTLAQAAGDMDATVANDYLIATDAAYKFKGSAEELNKVLDGQNYITNRNALSMSDLAEATKIAASQSASSGISIDKATAAMGTMIATTRQGGDVAARAWKGILMNVQQVSGELDDGEIIDAESLTKYEKACAELGVSLKEVKDGVLQLRDPMKILEELSEAYTSLDKMDARRANLISAVGGKYRGNQLNALLENWDLYEKMLSEYSQGSGSALEEAEKSANNLTGSLNKLGNTWTDTVENIANSKSLTNIVNIFDDILGFVNKITSILGGKGLAAVIGGGILGAKKINVDYLKMPVCPLYI